MHVWKENLSRLKKLMFVVGMTEFLRFIQTSLVRFNTKKNKYVPSVNVIIIFCISLPLAAKTLDGFDSNKS